MPFRADIWISVSMMDSCMSGLKIILSWGVCVFFLCGVLLWLRRHEGDRSRRYLCYTWFVASLAFLTRLVAVELGRPIAGRILPVENISGGLLSLLMLYLYPMEAINAGWLTWKRALRLFLPGMLVVVAVLAGRPYFRELESFQEVWVYIGEFNVWLRVGVMLVVIPLYSVLLLFIPYNSMKSRVCNRWILVYTIKIQLIGVLFMLFILTGSSLFSSLHILAGIVVAVSATYQEVFIRFKAPHKIPESVLPVETLRTEVPEEVREGNPLIGRLAVLMDEEQVWRNPDLTLPSLALLLHTNRSYLSRAIQEAGYKNFSDMLNRRRVTECLKIVDSGKRVNVQDVFFSVGFRSRETALRSFKKYTGVSPTDYICARASSMAAGGGFIDDLEQ